MHLNHGGCIEYDDGPEVTNKIMGEGWASHLCGSVCTVQGSDGIYIDGLVGGLLCGGANYLLDT